MRLDEIEIESAEPAEEEEEEEESAELHTDEDFLEAIELLELCHNHLKVVVKHYGHLLDPVLEKNIVQSCDETVQFIEHFVIPNVVED